MPTNLIIIVLAQAIILLIMLMFLKRTRQSSTINWPVAIGIGAGFGVLMDLVLGAYGIFAYLLPGWTKVPIDPRKLPVQVLIFNAIASYGLASASIAAIAPSIVVASRRNRGWSISTGLITVGGLLGVLLIQTASVGMMFAWGLVIIGTGELALHIAGKAGPFLAVLAKHDWHPLVRLWLCSSFLGATYEIINIMFPFWVWLPGSSINQTLLVGIIVSIGYVALLHPMAVLYILLNDRE